MIAIRVKTKNRQFLSRMDNLIQQTPWVRDETLKLMAKKAVAWIIANAPVDTGRYVNAVAMAGNGAKLGPFALRLLQRSAYRDRYLEHLEGQIDRWEKKVENLDKRRMFLYPHGAPAKNSRLYNRLQRDRERALLVLARAKEEMAKMLGSDYALYIGHLYSGNAQKGRRLNTVREMVYGGSGQFVSTRTGCSVILTIHEPHGKFVEKRKRLFARAREVLRTAGIAQIGKAQSLLAARSGLSVSAGMRGAAR